MMRLLLLLLLAFLVYQLVKPLVAQKKPPAKQEKTPEIEAHPMVQCSVCGTFIPQSDATVIKEKTFCSEACRTQKNV